LRRRTHGGLEQSIAESLARLGPTESSPKRTPSSHQPQKQIDLAEIPNDEFSDAIRLGEKIVTKTKLHAGRYVGNDLSCTNCHLQGGKKDGAAPWVGVWGVFPEYRSRSGRVNSLEDRVNDCFERSMNGHRLPADSTEMIAVLSYMRWLSSGVSTGDSIPGRGFKKIKPPQTPDSAVGKQLYLSKCSSCHGDQGQY
jgi:thiosulfate dehydrogenase